MNKNLHAFLIALLLIGGWSSAHAYELATHGRMTYEAFLRSVLNPNPNDPNDPQLLKKILGIGNGANPFGNIYYDVSGSTVQERTSQPFEEDRKKGYMPVGTEPLSIEGWLMRGAIREDDVLEPDNGQPVDDPYNTGNILLDNRVLNHFYDPVHDWPLTVGVTLGKRAPDWAVGVQDAFAQSPVPENGRRNHFAIFDARESMYRALTGKKQDGSDAGPGNQPTTEAHRKAYWATLFRALGDIAHLVQDMGQPQHTRNDRHSGACVEAITGHASVYEKYLDCRATGGPVEAIDNYQDYYLDACGFLTYTGYATPVFTKYSDYFATRDGTGRGLADYSNRNFFTAGANLGSNNYPSPPNDRSQYTEERIDNLVFLRGNVTDTQAAGTVNIRLTTESAFDYFLGTYRAYSLNRYNYDAQADLLIPRAVAYSAGFMNYFFRGRVEAEGSPDTDTYTDTDTATRSLA